MSASSGRGKLVIRLRNGVGENQQHGKWNLRRWSKFGFFVLAAAAVGVSVGLALVYFVSFPHVSDLESYRPISNTLLYDDEGHVFGSFALERRVIARYEDFPKVLYDAVLAIEDNDFERHPGFKVSRVLSAAYHDVARGEKVQGASTLTMQLARNLFLSPERSYGRKIREVLLAVQIERHFTKPQIFTLYANQIYLGHGVYGFATGAEFYFGKNVKDLTLEEAAVLAALPKAPNNYSPIRHPEQALSRRNLVINAMRVAGRITAADAAEARRKPLQLRIQDDPNSFAPYFVEEVRQYLERKYGAEQVHEAGLRVYTTLNVGLQKAANRAVLEGLCAYDHRHGWPTHLQNVGNLGANLETFKMPEWNRPIEEGSSVHAVVMSVGPSLALLRFGSYEASVQESDIGWEKNSSCQPTVGEIVNVKVLSLGPGPTARVHVEEGSGVQGALLAIDNTSGDVKAMVGGRDFNDSKFNRATQAQRQVGSSFKPYVYTAAIAEGAEPEDTVIDAPITFATPSGPYSPHNYDEKFEGLITLRHALAESRNIPAIKVAESVGIKNVIDYAHRFGISEQIPAYLPIALGAVEATLAETTSAYSVFPNDGVRVVPRYITKVTDYDGHVLEGSDTTVQDVIDERTARVMTSMLRDVVLHGTAISANRLKVPVAGKTGTTNDFTDAWFVGFSRTMTCGVWIGFDERKSLGPKETGARAALPVWIDFMSTAVGKRDQGRDFPSAPKDTTLVSETSDHRMLPPQLPAPEFEGRR